MLLQYDKQNLELWLPDGVPFKVISRASLPPLVNPHDTVTEALLKPVGAIPPRKMVHRGKSACILVNDTTRVSRSESFLPLLIDELLGAGIKKAISLLSLPTVHTGR